MNVWGYKTGLRLKFRVMLLLRLSVRTLASLARFAPDAKPKQEHYPKVKPEARKLSLSKKTKTIKKI